MIVTYVSSVMITSPGTPADIRITVEHQQPVYVCSNQSKLEIIHFTRPRVVSQTISVLSRDCKTSTVKVYVDAEITQENQFSSPLPVVRSAVSMPVSWSGLKPPATSQPQTVSAAYKYQHYCSLHLVNVV